MIERDLRIGGQTRALKITSRTLITFKSWMPGHIGMREALVLHSGDPGVVSIAIAACLRHKERGGDEKITPGRVGTWIDAEPKRFLEIEAATLALADEYFRAIGVVEDEQPGEAGAGSSPAKSSTSGTTSTGSPVDGGSTQD